MTLLGSNHKSAAAWNRSLAIKLLRRHGTLSRHDIARITQLQGSTLSYIVRELLKKNVVRVVGKRQSTLVGQKQVLLRLNPEVGWMLGVSLRPDTSTMVLLDGAGGRIDGMQSSFAGSLGTFPAQLRHTLDRWLKRRGTPVGKMLGLGVGIPGVVDVDAGTVLRSIPLHAVNVPLQQILFDEFATTVVVDHDACFGACAEATDGAAAESSDFIYMSVNAAALADGWRLDSYGSALFLQGKIFRGAFYGAGELTGGLEPAAMDISQSDFNTLGDVEGAMPQSLAELANRIGSALGMMINFADVQMVVLAGTAQIANRRFIAAVQAAVTDRLVSIPGRAVRVVRSTWEPEATARGAAIGAFDAVVAKGQLFGTSEANRQPQMAN